MPKFPPMTVDGLSARLLRIPASIDGFTVRTAEAVTPPKLAEMVTGTALNAPARGGVDTSKPPEGFPRRIRTGTVGTVAYSSLPETTVAWRSAAPYGASSAIVAFEVSPATTVAGSRVRLASRGSGNRLSRAGKKKLLSPSGKYRSSKLLNSFQAPLRPVRFRYVSSKVAPPYAMTSGRGRPSWETR